MARLDQFQLGTRYNLDTYAPTLFGTFNAVKIDGIVDHRMAYNYIDAAAQHAMVFGSLPAGSAPNDFTKYYYVVVTQQNGEKTALGLPWIVENSVVALGLSSATAVIEGVTADDLDKIRLALVSNGFVVAKIDLA